MTNIVLLNSEEHKNLKCQEKPSFEHLYNQNLIPLVASEFMYACNNFPVIFVKDGGTGEFRSAAMVGIDEGENLIFSQDRVATTYIPIAVQRYPFYASQGSEVGQVSLCADIDSALISETVGVSLFDENGKPSEFAQSRVNILADYAVKEAVTREFIDYLADIELLVHAQVSVNVGGEKKSVSGLYKVDENKLKVLSDDQILALHKKNYFSAIYSHLNSLGQIQKLLNLKS